MSVSKMIHESSVSQIESYICNVKDSLLAGMIFAYLYNNPFRLEKSKGVLKFSNSKEWGYCAWGMVYVFFQWIFKKIKELGIIRLFFVSRDGYLLKLAFEHYRTLCGKLPQIDYLWKH